MLLLCRLAHQSGPMGPHRSFWPQRSPAGATQTMVRLCKSMRQRGEASDAPLWVVLQRVTGPWWKEAGGQPRRHPQLLLGTSKALWQRLVPILTKLGLAAASKARGGVVAASEGREIHRP